MTDPMREPFRLLIPCDGSPSSLAAVDHAIGLSARGLAVEIHLLSVQPPLPATAASVTPRDTLADYHRERGMEALAEARTRVELAGLPLHLHISVGDPATIALAFAEKLACPQIVMGTHGRGALAGAVMGSVVTAIIAAGRVPVTVVHG